MKIWPEHVTCAYFQLWLIHKMFTELLHSMELHHTLENEFP